MLVLLGPLALASPLQTVDLAVAAGALPASTRLYAETTWIGEDRRTLLTDDGTVPFDSPGDGTRVARWTGPPARVLAVRVRAETPDGAATILWAGAPDLIGDHDRLTFQVDAGPPLRLVQVVTAPTAPAPLADPAAASLAGAGWGALALFYVLAISLPRRGRS